MSDITYMVQTGKGVKGSYTLVKNGHFEGDDAETRAKERYAKVKVGPGEKKRLMKSEHGVPSTVEQDLSKLK